MAARLRHIADIPAWALAHFPDIAMPPHALRAEARQPRALLLFEGQAVPVVSWEVDSNANFQADTFRALVPFAALPASRDLSWWSNASPIDVEIYAGFPADPMTFTKSDLELQFSGRVDNLEVDYEGRALTVDGRDRTADLIDTKTSEKYPNLTASQIVRQLAAAHGLTPVVTETSTRVGVYYAQDHVRLQDDRTEWDLITWLAREEGFTAYVHGSELHFEPKPTTDADAYVFDFSGGAVNGAKPAFRRSLTLAKDLKVIVRSWGAKKKGVPYQAVAQLNRTKNSVTRGPAASQQKTPTQQYVYSIPGLQPDEAQKRANQLLRELSAHEVKLSIEGPADAGLRVSGVIKVTGTNTSFDQSYHPDSIVRGLDAQNGYFWRIEAKNHATDSEADL